MIDPGFELRHLRYFLEVAETQNVSRAAERLGVSQPSISQQIKDLESALGTALFHRLGKRIRLTPAGQAFREQAQIVLRKLEDAVLSVKDVEGLARGHIDVGVIPTLCAPLIPRLLGRFAELHPGVSISIHELPVTAIETGLEAGRIDIGVGILRHTSPNIEYEKLCTESFAVLAPSTHRLTGRGEIAAKELADETLLLLPDRFPMRRIIDSILQRARIRPRVVEIDSLETILAALTGMNALTLVPGIIFDGRELPGLRSVKLKGPPTRAEIGLLWLRESVRSPAARAFAEVARELLAGRKS